MKICMVGSEIAPSKENIIIGGVANSVICLSQGLIENGHKIDIITSRPRVFNPNPNVPFLNIHQISILNKYPSFGYGLELGIRSLFKINKLDKSENFQIIHGHSGEPSIAAIPKIVGKLKNKPSIHTLYCPVESNDRYAYHFLSNIDVIIAISENVKKSLENIHIPSQNIRIVPPPIDTEKYNQKISGVKLRTKLGLNKEKKAILFIGNLTKTKGIDLLLDAMKIVIKDLPEAKLLMTLEMPHLHYSKRVTEVKNKIKLLGIDDAIIKFGIIDNMAEFMAASDIVVVPFLDTYGPSDYPLPLLESMSIGKPVIVTRIGGIPEVVQNMENGLLIDPNDVNLLSSAILNLLEDKKLQNKLGENASNLIIDKFSIKTVSNKMEEIYEDITRK